MQLLVGHGNNVLAALGPSNSAQVILRPALGGMAQPVHNLLDAVRGDETLATFEDEGGGDDA